MALSSLLTPERGRTRLSESGRQERQHSQCRTQCQTPVPPLEVCPTNQWMNIHTYIRTKYNTYAHLCTVRNMHFAQMLCTFFMMQPWCMYIRTFRHRDINKYSTYFIRVHFCSKLWLKKIESAMHRDAEERRCTAHLTPVTPEASTRIAKEVRWLLKQVTSELLEATSSLSRPLMDHPPTLRGRESAGRRDNMPCWRRDSRCTHWKRCIHCNIHTVEPFYCRHTFKATTTHVQHTKQAASRP